MPTYTAGNTQWPYMQRQTAGDTFGGVCGATAGHIKVKMPGCHPSRDVTETVEYRTLVSGERSGGLGGAVKRDIGVPSHEMG